MSLRGRFEAAIYNRVEGDLMYICVCMFTPETHLQALLADSGSDWVSALRNIGGRFDKVIQFFFIMSVKIYTVSNFTLR